MGFIRWCVSFIAHIIELCFVAAGSSVGDDGDVYNHHYNTDSYEHLMNED